MEFFGDGTFSGDKGDGAKPPNLPDDNEKVKLG